MLDPLGQLSLDDLRGRTSIKWRLHPDDVLPAWVAEMDVPLAPAVGDVLHRAVERGDTGYAVGDPYVAALAGFAHERWGWRLEPGHALTVADVMRGVVEAVSLTTGIGDAVIVNPPVYPPFYAFVRHAGRRILEAPLGSDHRLDADALDAAMREATADGRRAAYLLCSPHNPTGTVHTTDELAMVADLAARHGVRVVADEIHAPLVVPGVAFTPYLTVPGADDAFAVLSASKGWNLAGLKAAVLVAGPAASEELGRLPDVVAHGASHLGVLAHTAALTDGGDWLDAVRAGIARNRAVLQEALADRLPAIGYVPGDATYLAWLDCRALGLGDDPAAVFLERGRVALSGGSDFGAGGAGWVRLNLGTSPALVHEIVERMATAVDGPG